MKYAFCLFILATPIHLWSEEVADSQPESWISMIIAAAAVAISAFLAKFLNNKSNEAKKNSELIDVQNSGIVSELKHEFLDSRLIPFLYEAGANIAESKLPCILNDVANTSNGFDWKKHLFDIKDELKDLAIDKFKVEGIDIIAQFGGKYVDSLIERSINKAIPFAPVVLAKTEIGQGLGNSIIEKGLGAVKKQWLS